MMISIVWLLAGRTKGKTYPPGHNPLNIQPPAPAPCVIVLFSVYLCLFVCLLSMW